MNISLRILLAVIMGTAVYLFGLLVVPGIGFIKNLVETTFINKGNVTQFAFLVISLVLIFIFSRGKPGTFGFKGSKIKPLLLAVLVSIPAQLGMLVLMMFLVTVSGVTPPRDNLFTSLSFIETVLSVWIFASICEEILFRGLLYGFLQPLKIYGFGTGKFFVSLPVVVCALMFSLGHLCLLGQIPGIMVFAIVLSTGLLGFIAGYFRETSQSLLPAIAAHMTFNIVGYTVPKLLMSMVGS